ncbi:MAG: LysR family transcriptional regulator [Deltaproteobacteria bacterium]|nr:LysR family transcriptional regulator [Deltaproteobacteria bacterium]
MDRLHAMTTFVSVVDQGGFTQAARRLKVSPSAVTRSIAALEEHLGARLLQRTTRSVTLTDVGSRYLVRARQILADVQEAEESAQAERSAPTGHLVIAAPVVFGRLHVAPVVCAYLSRHPEVSCELTLGDRNVNLVEDGVDAAVRIGRQDDTTLVSRAIGATRRVLVASPRYLDARGAPESLAALADHDTIQFNPGSTAAEWRLTEGGEARRIGITPRFTTNSADAAIGHARLGGGITQVLAYQVADDVRAGQLVVVLPQHEEAPLPIQVVFPSTRLLSAKVRAFVDLIVETCDWRFVAM